MREVLGRMYKHLMMHGTYLEGCRMLGGLQLTGKFLSVEHH
jgi:hypothetical protein